MFKKNHVYETWYTKDGVSWGREFIHAGLSLLMPWELLSPPVCGGQCSPRMNSCATCHDVWCGYSPRPCGHWWWRPHGVSCAVSTAVRAASGRQEWTARYGADAVMSWGDNYATGGGVQTDAMWGQWRLLWTSRRTRDPRHVLWCWGQGSQRAAQLFGVFWSILDWSQGQALEQTRRRSASGMWHQTLRGRKGLNHSDVKIQNMQGGRHTLLPAPWSPAGHKHCIFHFQIHEHE